MQIDEPFYKVYFKAEGVVFIVVVNGIDVYTNDKGGPITLEIPINQFVRSGKNKLELQLHTRGDDNVLSLGDSAYIDLEYRLYTSLDDYVILNKLVYSARNEKQGEPFKSSSNKGQYSIKDHKLIADNSGDYEVSEFQLTVDKENYDNNYLYHIVTMPAPFPEWKFLTGDPIPDPQQFKTKEEMIDGLVGAPFNELKKIHTALSNKDINSIMPLFKERNDEMDKAFYYESGTYEKLLRESFEENYKKGRILKDLDINVAMPAVSPGKTIIQLGADPLIRFHNESKSVFIKYDIFFRKEGDKWIITR
ncbi:hypothetical protein MNBD_GAMMA10-3381 [hydrothermal vent metagenome]|uniref:Uncharacterized protein n=1 Tax=hydrothermal vent metagenome TaxID=652676 RepID=A0A3B0XSE1_9ZZZZ